MTSLAFVVYGDPVPQGSKRAFVVKGRAVVTDANPVPLKSWRSELAIAARAVLNGGGPELGPVRVTLFFHVKRPKRPKASLPATRPDIDKLARAVLDALTDAGVVRDDAQVTTLTARKRYTTGAPRVQVFVDGDA